MAILHALGDVITSSTKYGPGIPLNYVDSTIKKAIHNDPELGYDLDGDFFYVPIQYPAFDLLCLEVWYIDLLHNSSVLLKRHYPCKLTEENVNTMKTCIIERLKKNGKTN